MESSATRVARALPLAAALLLLGGCAVFQSERQVQATVILESSQSIAGEISFEDGARGCVVFTSGEARKGHPVAPDSWYYEGDPDLRISFPDSEQAMVRQERGLGFSSRWVGDGHTCRVVVRNAGTGPKAFQWTVRSRANAVTRWEVSRTGTVQ